MATPINAPTAGEIWHLSIEDLFQPVQEVSRLGGEGPFVINLSVSTAPISVPTKAFAGWHDAHVYQIQVTEDGRARFRLRLGPFTSEDEADAILAEVRDIYPGALTATASASDMRVIGTMRAKVDARQSSARRPDEKTAPQMAAAQNEAPQKTAAPQKAATATLAAKSVVAEKPTAEEADAEISIDIAWPTPELAIPPATPLRAAPGITLPAPPKMKIAPAVAPAPVAVAAPVLTEAVASKPKAPPASAVKAPAPKTVAPIAAPMAADKPALVLTQSVACAPKASAPKLRQSTFNTSATRLTSLQHVVVATAPAPAAREVKKLDKPLESLESTQTIRALTPSELEDIAASRWFVIQLALADHAFDPDAVPNLDIFGEYRLYSVAGLDQGRVVHALRLGFFREEIGAVAVASYLAAYWEKPTIRRVSVAERERFADQRVEARKDVGATGKHAVIEITDDLVVRRRQTSQSSVSAKLSNQPLGR
jgi:hypothetical protein